jgi:CubicO group peptidase (beta-lactamase class C family)
MSAPALPRAEPESVGLSSARLRRIGEALRRDIEAGQLPGAVIGIMRGGKLAHLEAVGTRDPATREPLKTDSIFSIASMTKAMTSTAIMLLVEEGRVLLADPVSKSIAAAGRAEGRGARRDHACAKAAADNPRPAAPHVGLHVSRPRHHPGARALSGLLRVGG